ncbi:hypothetical protein [Sporofaciens sp. SGI.106]|uniref:hypothetical protein n=1 Tax=Sporofaciens sp. SGI.106 TaxID=3420568 RepID=UPI003D03B781
MADISTYIQWIQNAQYGEDVRAAIINAITKINEDNESYENVKKKILETEAIYDEYAKLSERYAVGRDEVPESLTDNAKYYAGKSKDYAESVLGKAVIAKKEIDQYVESKESELKGETGNVFFAAFKVINGRLIMYSDPEVDKVHFFRSGSRLKYRINL